MARSASMNLVVGLSSKAAEAGFRRIGNSALSNLGRAATGVDKVSAKMTAFGVAMVGAAAIGGKQLYDLASHASNLGESVNAVTKVFSDEFAPTILNASADAANGVGLSERAFNEAAVSIGSLLNAMGHTPGESARMSKALIGLGSDMASIFNTNPEEAIQAIGAAFRGETEPIRRFGIQINDAAMKQYLFERTGKRVTGTLNSQQKAMATYGIIVDQTREMQGDFADTSDSLANAQRRLAANLENAKAAIGEGVLPMVEAAVGVFTDLVSAFNALPDPIKKLVGQLAGLTVGITALSGVVTILAARFLQAKVGTLALAAAQHVLPARFAASAASAQAAGKVIRRSFVVATVAIVAYLKIMDAINAKEKEREQRTKEVTQAYELQLPVLDDLAEAAARNGDEFDYATEAANAFAEALASSGDDGEKLTQSLGALGLQVDDVDELFVRMRSGAEDAFTEILKGAGVSDEYARIIAQIVDSSDNWLYIMERMSIAGIPEEYQALAASLEELQDQFEKTDLDQFGKEQLNAAVATSTQEKAIVDQANAIAKNLGLTEDSYHAWQIYNRIKGETIAATAESTDVIETEEEALQRLKDEQQEVIDALEDKVEALEESAEGHYAELEAIRASTDSHYALRKEQRDFERTLRDMNETLEETGGDLYEVAEAMDDVAQQAISVADAQVRAQDKTDGMGNSILTATERMDIFNRSMVESAIQAEGPYRDAIITAIAETNNIPESKMTLIAAAIAAGDYNTAMRLLTELSEARTVSVKADLDNAAAQRTRRDLEREMSKPIYVEVRPTGGVAGGAQRRASGGPVEGSTYLVGEQGPEAVTFGSDAYVTPNSALKRLGGTESGGGTKNITNNFTINTLDAYAIERHIRQRLKWTGNNWLGDFL